MKGMAVRVTPGRPQEVICLLLDCVSDFLFVSNASRVKESIRDWFICYQRERCKVLAEAFQEGRLTPDPDLAQLLLSET